MHKYGLLHKFAVLQLICWTVPDLNKRAAMAYYVATSVITDLFHGANEMATLKCPLNFEPRQKVSGQPSQPVPIVMVRSIFKSGLGNEVLYGFSHETFFLHFIIIKMFQYRWKIISHG